MFDTFKRAAEEFFHIRRKQRRARVENTCSDWRLLGRGHYSEAWAHHQWPDLVLKISGPAGWGADDVWSSYKGKEYVPKMDAWPVFARHCMQSPHMHLPTVYHVEQFSQHMSWGVIERYSVWDYWTSTDGEALAKQNQERTWHEVARDILKGHTRADAGWEWMWPLRQMASAMHFTVDLHSGNIMRDTRTGNLIITDPFSSPYKEQTNVTYT